MKKVLFVLKKRGTPYYQKEDINAGKSFSSGLFNSVNFINTMLLQNGVDSKIVEVIDNNCIDKEVTEYKPDIVIIEALWVVPQKFDILQKLHPNVKWIIRLHSEIPFLSNEGMALEWILNYCDYENVYISANTLRMADDLVDVLSAKYNRNELKNKILFLPNYYVASNNTIRFEKEPNVIDVACFGAIRPLKNQLIQAIAAIDFAKMKNKKLRFHINGSRIEHGNNVLKNIRNLFANLDSNKFELVEHDWLPHEQFLQLVAQMDIGMQVSYSETFNIVAADFVSQNIPIVTSPEIFWVNNCCYADPNSVDEIVYTMNDVYKKRKIFTWINRMNLKAYNRNSKKVWLDQIR